ncbi:hypothetical protein CHS0354_011002 [Potamilus streckersoni]|uniref:Uncharacterized protein n=1 Tax=Potamilus streckersoni TaxID=2493646 RepID=A0AAE0WEG7_9BIVA|nr:hypothetical protein CHS0354_011002 [Potamilus streckersoni]
MVHHMCHVVVLLLLCSLASGAWSPSVLQGPSCEELLRLTCTGGCFNDTCSKCVKDYFLQCKCVPKKLIDEYKANVYADLGFAVCFLAAITVDIPEPICCESYKAKRILTYNTETQGAPSLVRTNTTSGYSTTEDPHKVNQSDNKTRSDDTNKKMENVKNVNTDNNQKNDKKTNKNETMLQSVNQQSSIFTGPKQGGRNNVGNAFINGSADEKRNDGNSLRKKSSGTDVSELPDSKRMNRDESKAMNRLLKLIRSSIEDLKAEEDTNIY